jgi:hypothetical protein
MPARRSRIAATVELGRRRGDTSIINEAVELRRGRYNAATNFFDWLDSENWDDFSMTTEQIHAVLQRERHSRAFPQDRPAPFRVPSREAIFLDDDEPEIDDQPFALDDIARLVAEMSQNQAKRHKKARRDLPGQGDLF